MVKDIMEFLAGQDPEVGAAVQAEYDRQRRNIELIASENFVSPAVLAAAATVLTNKYAEGYPGKRYYGGCQCVDVVEDIARKRARSFFFWREMVTAGLLSFPRTRDYRSGGRCSRHPPCGRPSAPGRDGHGFEDPP